MANRKIREINLECGAVVHVNPESLDNAELLDAVVEGDEGDVRAVSRILRILLNAEDKKALYDVLREEDGRVPTARVADTIAEIFTKLGEKEEAAKN